MNKSSQHSKTFKLFSILLICGLGTAVYSNSFLCSFHFDDEPFITSNILIRNLYDLPGIWHFWHSRFIVFLSFAYNYHFNGLNVFGYHLVNLSVHLLSAVLVWWLVLLTLASPALKDDPIRRHADLMALLAGLIFISHPVQIEAVTYIWQRAASMAAMFYLASLCFYVKSRLLPPHDHDRIIYYVSSLIAAVLAMFCKENAVTLPMMILFYEFTFLSTGQRFNLRPLVPLLLTVCIVPVTYLFHKSQVFAHAHGNFDSSGENITPVHYTLTHIRAVFTYMRLCFFPVHQNVDYEYPIFKSILQWPVWLDLLGLAAIFYWTKRIFTVWRLISFAIGWFFLTLNVPESFWALGDIITEHRLYLPLAGYSIFLVSAAYYFLGKKNMPAMTGLLALVIACNSVATWQRNKVWKDELTLWNDAVSKSPHKSRPYCNRGNAYLARGNLSKALSDFNKAVEVNPNDPTLYFDRGFIYRKLGKPDKALVEYTKALTLDPGFLLAYNGRGMAFAESGRFNLALREYGKALEINPHFTPAFINRLKLYYQLKEKDKVLQEWRKLKDLGPNTWMY